MKRHWKLGDVAEIDGDRCMYLGRMRGWEHGRDDLFAYPSSADARPLVVIDPEDREQVKRLFDMAFERGGGPLALTDALVELANPTPPRMDEPGTWGVVEASCPHSDTRRPWVHHPDGNWWPALDYLTVPERTPLPDDWSDLIDPALIREGVQ